MCDVIIDFLSKTDKKPWLKSFSIFFQGDEGHEGRVGEQRNDRGRDLVEDPAADEGISQGGDLQPGRVLPRQQAEEPRPQKERNLTKRFCTSIKTMTKSPIYIWRLRSVKKSMVI